MAGLSLGVGWLVAGRLLRPLRSITTTAREISATNLHERLNIAGPDDELKELADTFDGLLARLERAFAFERQFVANASHELRTPLAGMRTSLDVAMAKPGPVPPQFRTLADRLRRELDHVDRLLESFLTLAHTQHGPLADQSTVSLTDIARLAIERRADAISAIGLEVERQERPDAWVTGSETLLSRMVENVIDNAIGHNQSGGWVRVATEVEDKHARLVVENGGPVLAQEDVSELTRPFRRLGAQRTGSDRGAGLGLAIVASIAEVHGGTVDLEALRDGGLRVAIALPLAVRAAAGAPA
jgi:signal transduction histidine kinase